jgi:hypothetical protein
MKERIRLLSAVLCTGHVILSAFTAAAGPCCFVEVGVDHILKDGTTGMSSNDRLKWYLEQTGRPVDEAVARAQDEISENCVKPQTFQRNDYFCAFCGFCVTIS